MSLGAGFEISRDSCHFELALSTCGPRRELAAVPAAIPSFLYRGLQSSKTISPITSCFGHSILPHHNKMLSRHRDVLFRKKKKNNEGKSLINLDAFFFSKYFQLMQGPLWTADSIMYHNPWIYFRSAKKLNTRNLSDVDYIRYGGTHCNLSNQEVEAEGW